MTEGAQQYVIFTVGCDLVPLQEEKIMCALVERIYLILVSREGNHD